MELIYDTYEGKGAFVKGYEGCTAEDGDSLAAEIAAEGYKQESVHTLGGNTFAYYKKGTAHKILALYPEAAEAKLVSEEGALLHGLYDEGGAAVCKPQLTMVDLFDFGLSLVLRLTDGRFIVFDGGWEIRDYAERLMAVLKKQCVTERITIAAWIMTHPHIDHYRCYLSFAKKFENQYTVQRFIYNFFDSDTKNDYIAGAEKEGPYLQRFFDAVKESGAPSYRGHTGDVFSIGGARFECLSSPDDTLKNRTTDINGLSLVYKIRYAEQTILVTGDCAFPQAHIAERFGAYLKSDILQVPHHMFYGGSVEAYRLIDPETILIPCEDEYVFSVFSTRANSTKAPSEFLMRDLHVKDCFVGARGDAVLILPYTPRENGRALLLADLENGDRSIGARDWYFVDITAENGIFTVLNTSWETARFRIDVISEAGQISVHDFKELTVPKSCYKTFSLTDPEGYEPEARGGEIEKYIQSGRRYVVRFRCYTPMIVKGPIEPIYHS